ncbi:MAG: hypothetical protein B0A82_07540 [Alkalinema sp. CACIAM 70d]|nr:MAG: hypothetical protein B0A82_07540 [Alkalinema sp. CACIAM 70d]
MSDSVLDRIRQNRQRASVPPRNDALIPGAPASEASSAPSDSPVPVEAEETGATVSTSSSDALEDLKAELTQIPETTRHSAIVLDKQLDQALTRYCKDNRITVEVFLEAAWNHAASNPEALQTILTEAKRRYADRKRAGKLRRLITMLEGKS